MHPAGRCGSSSTVRRSRCSTGHGSGWYGGWRRQPARKQTIPGILWGALGAYLRSSTSENIGTNAQRESSKTRRVSVVVRRTFSRDTRECSCSTNNSTHAAFHAGVRAGVLCQHVASHQRMNYPRLIDNPSRNFHGSRFTCKQMGIEFVRHVAHPLSQLCRLTFFRGYRSFQLLQPCSVGLRRRLSPTLWQRCFPH